LAKILVVDDEPDVEALVRQVFRRRVRAGELSFEFAGNGQEALDALARQPDIDMILTDINMPVMDGLTLLEQLRGADSVTKAVVVSAYGDMQNIRTAMNRGAFDFITKPIDREDLALTVDKTLTHLARLREALRSHDQLVAIRRELEVASRLQQSILPKRFPTTPNFEIYANMRPAKEVGGDFYDFFEISPTRVGLVIADVSGKGIAAALFMAVSHTLLRASALAGLNPGDCLARVNDLLAADNDATMFVTVFYGVLDVTTGEILYANGGHNPPCVVGAAGTAPPLEGTGGMALGVFQGAAFGEKRFVLAPGDAVFLYTDGVTEAFNADDVPFGNERLAECLADSNRASPQTLLGDVTRAVAQFVGETEQADDITCLALSFAEPVRGIAGEASGVKARVEADAAPGAEQELSVVLKNDLGEIPVLAEAVERFGDAHAWPMKLVLDLNLALEELITNTISYGYADPDEHRISVSLRIADDTVVVDIEDDAKPFDPFTAPKPDIHASLEDRAIGGLGVHIVKTLMDGVNHSYADGRNHVRLEKVLPAAG
jgi:sigma-B regulation protein RsbU (phosphoserine phosphatase)